MIRWISSLEPVAGLGHAWAWPVRLDGPEAVQALASSPARACDHADAALLRNPDAGARRLLRRRLLRALVAKAQGRRVDQVTINRTADGAPVAEGAFVSLAARGDWALVAVGPTPLGVDLEIPDDGPPCEGGEMSWAAWTAREAYAKAAGVSLDAALAAEVSRVTVDRIELMAGAVSVTARRFELADLVCAGVVLPG